MIARLHNERGTTILETLATTIIISVAMIGLYIGIMYADKQVQRNYHDRIATLLASGELDWQAYYKKNYKQFSLFTNRTVFIANLENGDVLNAKMSTRLEETYESQFGLIIPYSILEVSVRWIEPGDNTARRIVVREEFY
jgi:Tfp pilus assembly protein PilV